MNAPPTSTPPPDASLDDQIRAVELRLIAREESLRQRVASIPSRMRLALRPKRLVAPLLVAAGAGAALWLALRLARRASPRFDRLVARRHARAMQVPAWVASLPWASLLALAWPLLPQRWRNRVSPATATTTMSIVLPWMQRLFSRRAPGPGGVP